ncbi:hypothetical protein Gotri_028160 [Gossypium trilobum]|uniref:Uncharacterized protein n=1 Tax=Gossypium trilobum TaxID=34281 RepID=A0A7J9FI01_9ROSI|nr:hypothetical protein [Gossypium trilobum]
MEISHDQDHVDEISQSHFEESVDDNNTSDIVDFLKEIDDDDDNYECLLEENEDDGDIDDNNYIDDRQSQIDTWNFDDHPLFEQDYRCLPLSFHDKINDDLSVGNRIIMPSTDLEFIIENQVPLPLQFEIHNLSEGKFSHCGVLEFSGHEDGVVFLPDWMMENLQLKACDFVYMKNKKLEKGSYIKIQPHTSDFISIPNPKAVLEENLRKFCCLTKGDTIIISHGSKRFYIDIVETKPDDAISIVDIDCNVDFAPALDYEEHAIPVSINFGLKKKEEKEEETQKSEFKPFTGLARKLNAEPCCSTYLPKIGRNREVGEANSKRSSICKSEVTNQNKETEDKPKFQAFTGRSYT